MPDIQKVDPLTTQSRIGHAGDQEVTPSSFFLRQWQLLRQFANGAGQNLAALIAAVAKINATTITGTGALGGGGAIGVGNLQITHDDSAVTPGVYGDATHVAQVTVDQYGHVTAAANVAISGGGGGGGPSFFGRGATGERRQFITLSAVNGNGNPNDLVAGQFTSTSFFWLSGTGGVLTVDFGAGTEGLVALSGWAIRQSDATVMGTWQTAYSDDDITYTDVGAPFAWGGAQNTLYTFANTTGARYWRVYLVAGVASATPYINYVTYRIDGYPF